MNFLTATGPKLGPRRPRNIPGSTAADQQNRFYDTGKLYYESLASLPCSDNRSTPGLSKARCKLEPRPLDRLGLAGGVGFLPPKPRPLSPVEVVEAFQKNQRGPATTAVQGRRRGNWAGQQRAAGQSSAARRSQEAQRGSAAA